MRGPGWRAWILIVFVAMTAVVVAAWVYVPDFHEAVGVSLGGR